MSEKQYAAFGLVRKADGTPRIDDPENMPAEMKAMLTDGDLAKLPRATVEKLKLAHRLPAPPE
jgi:hypothetical protein